MLIVKRLPGEAIHVLPSPDLDPDMRVSDLFKDGNIEIHLLKSQYGFASIGVDAPESLVILRNELLDT